MFGTKIIKSPSDVYILKRDTKAEFLRMERFGTVFVFAAAVLLHFIYDISGHQAWSVIFGAVNESVWEHIKIFALPYVIWSFIELFCIRLPFKRFVVTKTATLYLIMIAIPLLYYAYTAALGTGYLWVDILISVLVTVLAFFCSYKIMTEVKNIEKFYPLALFMLAVYYIMFAFFTAAPPKIFLFQDPVTGVYGIS